MKEPETEPKTQTENSSSFDIGEVQPLPAPMGKYSPENLKLANYYSLQEYGLEPEATGKLLRFCEYFGLSATLVLQFPEVVKAVIQAPSLERLDDFITKHPKMVKVLCGNFSYLEVYGDLIPQLAGLDEALLSAAKEPDGLDANELDVRLSQMERLSFVMESFAGLFSHLREKAGSNETFNNFMQDLKTTYNLAGLSIN